MIERTWPQGMRGMENGTVKRTVVADAAADLSELTCVNRKGMKGNPAGTVFVVCKKKGNSI